MHPIISIVGKSGSGKTTLLEGLIAELKKRGLKVAIVKHSHHADDLDSEAKDTWRFTRAGSAMSAINSLDHLAIYRRMEHFFEPHEVSASILWDFDLILTEGFKGSSYPKIEVHRREQGKELLTDPSLLIAVVTDEPLDVKAPQFSSDDVPGIADLIEGVLTKDKTDDINMIVNGEAIDLSPSQRDLLRKTLLTMLPSSTDGIRSLHVSMRRRA